MEGRFPTLYLRTTSLTFTSSAHFPSRKNQRQGRTHSGTYISHLSDLVLSINIYIHTHTLLFGNWEWNSKKFSVVIYHLITPHFPLFLSFSIHHLNFQLDSISLHSQWYPLIYFISDYINSPLSIFLTNILLNEHF